MYESLLEHDLEDEVAVAGDVATELDPKLDDDEDTETDELADDADLGRPTGPTMPIKTPNRCSTRRTTNRGRTTPCGCT